MKKYIQLYNYLRDAIECGDWAPQMQLPTESALSEQFQMSRQTVRQALAALKNDNYIYSVRGSGSFVSPCAGKKAENKRIAVVTTYFSEYIFPSILRGICNVAVEHGYAVELSSSNNSIKQERAIPVSYTHLHARSARNKSRSSPSTVVFLVMCTNSMSIIQAQSFICSAVTS